MITLPAGECLAFKKLSGFNCFLGENLVCLFVFFLFKMPKLNNPTATMFHEETRGELHISMTIVTAFQKLKVIFTFDSQNTQLSDC